MGMTRRHFLPTVAAARLAAPFFTRAAPAGDLKGRLKQSVTRSVFGRGVSLEQACEHCVSQGIKGFDLIGIKDWPMLKKYGLMPTMVPGAMELTNSTNDKSLHPCIELLFKELIPRASDAGQSTISALSATRRGESGVDSLAILVA